MGSCDCQIRSVFDDRPETVGIGQPQEERGRTEEEALSPNQVTLTDHTVYVWGAPPSADLELLA